MAATRDSRSGWSFVAFPLAVLFVFSIIPTLMGILLSLFEWDGGDTPRFIGVRNYLDLLNDPAFTRSFVNTLVFTGYTVPITIVGAFLIAVALNAPWFRGRHILRVIFFLPTVVSIVAIGFIWRWMLESSDAGLLNHLLIDVFNLPRERIPDWLVDDGWALGTVIVVSIWRGLGFAVVLYLAALGGVPRSQYDAAAVDGAGAWATLWNVTWPGVRPMTIFLAITGVIGALQVFDIVFVMVGQLERPATDVLNLVLYREFTHDRLGYAAAIGVVILVTTLVVTAAQIAWLRHREATPA